MLKNMIARVMKRSGSFGNMVTRVMRSSPVEVQGNISGFSGYFL
jgi:hypothetical protein